MTEGPGFLSKLPLKSHLAERPQPAERAWECAWREPCPGWTSLGFSKPSGLRFSFPDKLQVKSQLLTEGLTLDLLAGEWMQDVLTEQYCCQVGLRAAEKGFCHHCRVGRTARSLLSCSPDPRFHCLFQLENFCSYFPSAGKGARDLVQAELRQLMHFPVLGYATLPLSRRSRTMLERRLPSISPQTPNPSCITFPTVTPSKHHLLRIPHHLQGS